MVLAQLIAKSTSLMRTEVVLQGDAQRLSCASTLGPWLPLCTPAAVWQWGWECDEHPLCLRDTHMTLSYAPLVTFSAILHGGAILLFSAPLSTVPEPFSEYSSRKSPSSCILFLNTRRELFPSALFSTYFIFTFCFKVSAAGSFLVGTLQPLV